MKQITLAAHKQTFILTFDDDDFEKIKNFPISINNSRGKYFAYVRINALKSIMIQRFVLNEPEFRIGFKDNNTMNFVKDNLYLKNHEYRSNAKRKYYKNNREKIVTNACNHYQTHKEHVKEYQREYRKLHKDHLYEGKKRRRAAVKPVMEKDPVLQNIKKKYNYLKNTAKQRLLPMTLSFEEYVVLIKQNCYYTKQELINEGGSSLDRIDNTKGYILENVIPCICWVNRMRGNHLTVEETKIAVKAILNYRKKHE